LNIFQKVNEELCPGENCGDFLEVETGFLLAVFYHISVGVVYYHRIEASQVHYSQR
jgi:hypothetical protein